MINAANRMGVIVRQQGGSYQPGMFDHLTTDLLSGRQDRTP